MQTRFLVCRHTRGYTKNCLFCAVRATLPAPLLSARNRSIAKAALRGTLNSGRSAVTDIRIVYPPDEVRWVRIRAGSNIDGQRTLGQLSGMTGDIQRLRLYRMKI